MKPVSSKITAGALLGLLLIIGSRSLLISGQGPANPSPAATGDFSKRNIHGAWQIAVQPRDCNTGNPGPIGFRGLLTFAEGGTISHSMASLVVPPPVASSPGHGVWTRHDWKHYTAKIISLRINLADGTFAGWATLEVSLQLSDSGDEFTGTGTFKTVDANGVVFMTGCAAWTGTRLQ